MCVAWVAKTPTASSSELPAVSARATPPEEEPVTALFLADPGAAPPDGPRFDPTDRTDPTDPTDPDAPQLEEEEDEDYPMTDSSDWEVFETYNDYDRLPEPGDFWPGDDDPELWQ